MAILTTLNLTPGITLRGVVVSSSCCWEVLMILEMLLLRCVAFRSVVSKYVAVAMGTHTKHGEFKVGFACMVIFKGKKSKGEIMWMTCFPIGENVTLLHILSLDHNTWLQMKIIEFCYFC